MLSSLPEKFRRISSTPAYRLVAEAIERQILTGRIRPGEPIGTEAELVKQFGVNRSTVREGIRLLEAHRMMLDAIMRRDKEAARLWARRHINDWRKGFERAGNDLDQPIDKIYLQSLVKEEAAAD